MRHQSRGLQKGMAVILAGSMVMSLAACGTKDNAGEAGADETQIESTASASTEGQAAGGEQSETADGSTGETAEVVKPTSSELVAVDYEKTVAANRSEDGSKKYVISEITPTICFDNLELGYLTEAAATYQLELAEGAEVDGVMVSAVNDSYTEVGTEELAVWDESAMILTANQEADSEGRVFLDLMKDDEVLYTVTVNVKQAYPSDPEYDIDAETVAKDECLDYWDNNTSGGYDGNVGVHDPALTEVEIDGTRYYYMVQTGWAGGNILRRSTDLMHWEYLGKTTPDSSLMEAYGWTDVDDWMLAGAADCQYWAADLVPAEGGGYWLYTCIVNSDVDEEHHDRVCIVQAWSATLEANSFFYTGVVLQSISDYAQDALYYNVVALDPQIVYDNGKMYMTYGSFGAGIYMIELDPVTGLRLDGQTDWLDVDTVNANMEAARETFIGESTDYYGLHMTYCAEGSVIAHQYDVTLTNEDGTETEEFGDYYYMMTCLGVLARNYVLFTAKSDHITGFTNLSGDPMASDWIGRELVTGLYPPISGYRSDLDRDSYITTAGRIEGSVEYTAMSSFKWADYDFDIHAPGHGDLYTTSDGVNIAQLMVRTLAMKSAKTDQTDNGYQIGASSTDFMMQAHQYYINSAGDLVINANRYAGEADRAVTQEEFLAFSDNGAFQMVLAGDPYVTTEGIYVTLGADGTISGAAAGTWKMYGDNYIRLDVEGYDTYLGVVSVSWLDNKNCVGMTATAMGQTTGNPLYLNSETTVK